MSTTETGQIWLTAAYFLQTAGDDGSGEMRGLTTEQLAKGFS